MQLLFDIGGTFSRFAVTENGTIGTIQKVPTPQDFDIAMTTFSQVINDLRSNGHFTQAAGCSVGPLNFDKSRIINPPNLPKWHNKPLRESLEKISGCPVMIENDADLAGLGEATYGAGKGKSIVVYYTISTGVGGARIVDGQIDKSRFGTEPGHQIIDPNDPKGHLEGLISGTALLTRYGKAGEEIQDPAIWSRVAESLAIGLHNSIVHWSPDIIILGGSVMKSLPLDLVLDHLKSRMHIFTEIPELVLTTLDEPGLYGALSLLEN